MVEEPSVPASHPQAPRGDRVLRLWQAVVMAVGAASLSIVFRPSGRLFDQPLTEDGFYSFRVAYNVAHGLGMTIDGQMWTNGFQPLFTALTVPAFWLAGEDRWLAIRLVLFLHWLVYVGTACVLGAVVAHAGSGSRDDRRRRFWSTAAAYLVALTLFMHHFNGLETGFLLMMYAVAWRIYQSLRMESVPALIGFGAILGLLVLTRIDAAIFVATLCSYLLVRPDGSSLQRRMLRAVVIGLTALLVSSPWWAYNYLEFGSVMPSSGRAQWQIGVEGWRFSWASAALSKVLMPWIYSGMHRMGLSTLVRCAAIAAALVLLIRSTRPRPGVGAARAGNGRRFPSRTAEFAVCLGLSCTLLATYYTFFTKTNIFYERYLTPLALLAVFGASTLLTRAGGRARAACAGGMGVLLLGMFATLILMRTDLLFTGNQYYYNQLGVVRDLVPDEEWVAAGQSGTLGFFRDRVVNLDGKVNSEVLAFGDHTWDYLRQRGIVWFCDWKLYGPLYLGDPPESHGWHWIERKGNFVLYHYEGPGRRGG